MPVLPHAYACAEAAKPVGRWLAAATRTRYKHRGIFRSVTMVMVVTMVIDMAIAVVVAIAVGCSCGGQFLLILCFVLNLVHTVSALSNAKAAAAKAVAVVMAYLAMAVLAYVYVAN